MKHHIKARFPRVEFLVELALAGSGGATTLAGGANGPAGANLLARVALPTALFIDPANSSGHASDSNPGTSSGAPILTTAHLNALMFQRGLTANSTVEYMSDDSSGVGLDVSTLARNGFTLSFVGTPVALHTGGTLNAGTVAIDPATNQRQVVHSTDIADWSSFVGGLLVDTTTSSSAPIMAAAGAATASTGRPLLADGSAGAFTSGDAYKIQRGSTLLVGPGPVVEGGISFTDFSLTGTGPVDATYTRCRWSSSITVGGNATNCYAGGGFFQTQAATMFWTAGGIFTGAADAMPGLLFIQSDTYIFSPIAWVLSAASYANVFVAAGVGAGIQLQDIGSDAEGSGVVVTGTINLATQSLYWGQGNKGGGFNLTGGSCLVVEDAVNTPTVAGTLVNGFAFVENPGPFVTVARAWDPSTGAFTESGGVATRTTTWAHLIATIGAGGFGRNAQAVETGALVVAI